MNMCIRILTSTVTDEFNDYAQNVFNILQKNGIRCLLDHDSDKITYKVRKHSLAKIPLIVVLGKKEREKKLVSIRRIGDTTQETLELDQFIDKLLLEIQRKGS